MDVKLEVATGPKAGQLIPVTGEKFLIGRAEDCHLKPRSELISRYHCAIISTEAYVAVRDLGSKNGILLNGNRVTLETAVADGDKLVVGPLEFIVRVTISAKATKKPKVESVAAAAKRTVELYSAPTEDEKFDVSAWLGDAEDMDISDNQDTITVAGPVIEGRPPEMPAASTSANKPQEEVSTPDAAASAMRNFFHGGK